MQEQQVLQCENAVLIREEDKRDKVVVSLDTINSSSDELKGAPIPRNKLPAGSRKKVSFTPNSPAVSVSNTKELTDSERQKVWYNRQDMQSIRKRARTLALRIHSDRDKNDFEYSYACTMEAVFKQARDLSEEEELKLWAWFSQAHARRGLERLSANQTGRNKQAKAAIRKVLHTQKELSRLQTDGTTKANMLAVTSQIETDQARALAQVFGTADMVAATMNQLEQSSS